MANNIDAGQYSLFEEPQNDIEQTIDETQLGAELERLCKLAYRYGIYFPGGAGEDIYKRYRAYEQANHTEIEHHLNASGLTHTTLVAVKLDYLCVLEGYYNFSAQENQMREALDKLKSNEAFMIDRYGFWRLLLNQYYKIIQTINRFNSIKESDTETKQRFIETFPPEYLRAAAWAILRGIITPLHFAGVPPDIVANFATSAQTAANITDYGNFYHLCKYAYCATPEELETIPIPNGLLNLQKQEITSFLDEFCGNCEQEINQARRTYTQAMETTNPELGNWSQNRIKVSSNLTAILQKPLEVQGKAAKTQSELNHLPIRTFFDKNIDIPIKDFEQYKGLVTEELVQTVYSGLDVLRSFKRVTPINGVSTHEISMEYFAKICGYKDINQQKKNALFGALLLLNNLYVWCDRPIKSKSGRKSKPGVWLKIFDLREYTDDRNQIVIDIHEPDLGKELLPVTTETMRTLQKETNGKVPESRFTKQILGKDHKEEEDLLDACFGYSDKLKFATTPEEYNKKKNYIRKHKPSDRKRLQEWFEKYKKIGFIINYTRTQNMEGKWIYNWTRNTAEQIEAGEKTTKAEIIDAEQQTH